MTAKNEVGKDCILRTEKIAPQITAQEVNCDGYRGESGGSAHLVGCTKHQGKERRRSTWEEMTN